MFFILALLLVVEAGSVSIAWAKGKPEKPPSSSFRKYGYAMFRDGDNDMIKSDGGGQYIDCHLEGGEDKVVLSVSSKGDLKWALLYPGRMFQEPYYPTYPPSSRRVWFCFDVPRVQTDKLAVRDILLKYKDGENYVPRSSTHGFLDDGSVHAPVVVHRDDYGTDRIQFVVDPKPDPATDPDPKAITLTKINEYYGGSEPGYWYTSDELDYDYVIYTLDYGYRGFNITPVEFRRKKPVTWVIKPETAPVLYVNVGSFSGEKVILAEYGEVVSFELALSLNPLETYPISGSGAPKRIRTISATWGGIKAGY